MTTKKQLYRLKIDAHNLDEEFEQIILEDYSVKVADRSGQPWSVLFEGEREQLVKMVQEHWGVDLNPSELILLNDDPA